MSFLRIRIVVFIFAVSAFLGYLAWQESTLAFTATTHLGTMTLKELIARGGEGNPHILLTDFFADENLMIYDGGDEDGGWREVWVPLVTGDVARAGDKQPPGSVKAILCSKHIGDPDDLAEVAERSSLSVVVLNQVASLPDDIEWMLKSRYEGLDLSKCLILEYGREPGSLAWFVLSAVGCVLGIVLGIVVLIPGYIFGFFAKDEPAPEPSQT